MINADEKLREVFGKAKVSMFEITKIINQHLSKRSTHRRGGYLLCNGFTGAAAVLSSITELPGTIVRIISRSSYL